MERANSVHKLSLKGGERDGKLTKLWPLHYIGSILVASIEGYTWKAVKNFVIVCVLIDQCDIYIYIYSVWVCCSIVYSLLIVIKSTPKHRIGGFFYWFVFTILKIEIENRLLNGNKIDVTRWDFDKSLPSHFD